MPKQSIIRDSHHMTPPSVLQVLSVSRNPRTTCKHNKRNKYKHDLSPFYICCMSPALRLGRSTIVWINLKRKTLVAYRTISSVHIDRLMLSHSCPLTYCKFCAENTGTNLCAYNGRKKYTRNEKERKREKLFRLTLLFNC